MRNQLFKTFLVIFLTVFFIRPITTVSAQVSKMDHGAIDPKELESFSDRFFKQQMKEKHIPGAVFVFVKDGKVLLSKGYGYADLQTRRPVDPGKTIFPIGSVSKIFTSMAALQLVERGLIGVNDDVNKFLVNYHIANHFSKPVTISTLLTHTSGFDQKRIGLFVKPDDSIQSFGDFLSKRMPPLVDEPGTVFNYSNFGMVLTGCLIEDISGVGYEKYLNDNLFTPLGMTRTNYMLPSSLKTDLVTGYCYIGGKYIKFPFATDDYRFAGTAGGITTTANDMAKFIIAHLQNGRYLNQRIMAEHTMNLMHRRHFSYHPALPGMAYGFREHFQNQQRLILHTGTYLPPMKGGTASLLCLIPDQKIGFFLSYNQISEIRLELIDQFLDHYYPVKKRQTPEPVISNPKELMVVNKALTGNYISIEYSRTIWEKAILLFGGRDEQYNVTANPDGTINIGSKQYYCVKERLFKQVNGDDYAFFKRDGRGRISHLFTRWDTGPAAFEKMVWYKDPGYYRILFGVLLVILICNLFIIPRIYRDPGSEKLANITVKLVYIIISINLLFLLGFILGVAFSFNSIMYGMSVIFYIIFTLPLINAVLSIMAVILAIIAWRRNYWSLGRRLYFSFLSFIMLVFICFLGYWNLLGYKF